jgi:hypothetical protein
VTAYVTVRIHDDGDWRPIAVYPSAEAAMADVPGEGYSWDYHEDEGCWLGCYDRQPTELEGTFDWESRRIYPVPLKGEVAGSG